jgi:hypothetical protein
MHLSLDICVFHRKVRGCHDRGEDVFHKFAVKRATVHMQLGASEIQGLEEGKTHQMVPVGMGENKMDLARFFVGQLIAKSSNAGSGIHDNYILTFGADFQTGSIPAILQILFSGNRY